MRKIFFIVFTFVQCFVFAQTDSSSANSEKNVTITASGSGKTQDDAKQSALRSAIEQAFGAFISSKTEVLNDQVVADQIASVSSGNIQSFEVLNASQFPDGSWGVTLKALVSVSKLTSFVEAKGIAIEIKGGLFALNIKQQLLNEQGEIKAVCEMVGLLHEPMQISFDYTIKSGDPKSLDAESKNWAFPLTVTATANANMDFCANYLIKTLSALSLSAEEVQSYKSLNKEIFPVKVYYKKEVKIFYLRKQTSMIALYSLLSNWEFYTRCFNIRSGIDEILGEGKGSIHKFGPDDYWVNQDHFRKCYKYKFSDPFDNDKTKFIFLSNGETAAIFSLEDKKTLEQIDKMNGYIVKPSGVRSQFKHGGFVVYEKDGQGLVAALFDLMNRDEKHIEKICEELILNGYNDWRPPNLSEVKAIGLNLINKGLGNFRCGEFARYMIETPIADLGNDINHYVAFNLKGEIVDDDHTSRNNVRFLRPVRSFK